MQLLLKTVQQAYKQFKRDKIQLADFASHFS